MSRDIDILKELENLDNQEILSNTKLEEENIISEEIKEEKIEKNIIFKYQISCNVPETKKQNKWFNVVWTVIFVSKYLATTAMIFLVLLVTTNYSAYMSIAKSVIFSWQVEQTKKSILSSVEAAKIKSKVVKDELNSDKEEVIEATTIEKYKKELDEKNVNLDIEITPFTNRIVIPKIGKNIPLLDVKNKKISWESELNDIFMKELEEWIIRYPGSAKPGNKWNSFIFWHSSNLPWMKWDYNDVFANLDAVSYWDEVIAYYGQEKFTYKITQKRVIRPGDVSVLKQKQDESQITLMTCRPIWTTLNRLVVIGELVEE